MRDVKVRTFPSDPVSPVRAVRRVGRAKTEHSTPVPATVLHRDVRRIVVLLPVEEQNSTAGDAGEEEGEQK